MARSAKTERGSGTSGAGGTRPAAEGRLWRGVSAAALLAAATAASAGEASAADCHALGGNAFSVDGPGADLDSDCTGAADGATVNVTADIGIAEIIDGAGGIDRWTVTVNNGITITNPYGNSPIQANGYGMKLINEGRITSMAGGAAISAGGAPATIDITNRGVIEETGLAAYGSYGIYSDTATRTIIVNEAGGQILGNSGAIFINSASASITNGGLIANTDSGAAITFASGNFSDSLTLLPGSVITGAVEAGGGTDYLFFGEGSGNFDLDDIDTGTDTRTYRDFDTFQVNAGNWQFTGSTVERFIVSSESTLGGTGTFGGIEVRTGGSLAPGHSIGTTGSTDDVWFRSGSTYRVELDDAGNSDLLNLTGTAVLTIDSGTTLDVAAMPGIYVPGSRTYLVAAAEDSITGTFTTVTDNLPDVDFTPTYTPTTIELGIVQAPGAGSEKSGFSAGTAGAMGSSYLFNRTIRRRTGFVVPTDRQVWGAPMGRLADVDADGALAGRTSRTGGFAMGVERRFRAGGGDIVAGVAGGYSRTSVDSGGNGASVDSKHGGVYGAADFGALTVAGSLSADLNAYDFSRSIPLGNGSALSANGGTDGYSVTAGADVFYDLVDGHAAGAEQQIAFGPLARIETLHARNEAFSESGAGVLNLSVDEQRTRQSIASLGAGLQAASAIGNGHARLDARIAWERVLHGNETATTARLAASPDITYDAATAGFGVDRLALGIGATFVTSQNLSAHLRYEGRFSGGNASHEMNVGLNLRF